MFFVVGLLACTSAPPTPAPAPAAPAPAAAPAAPAPKQARQTNAAGLKADLDAKKVPVLVDVRTSAEFAAGHVPGALNLPIDTLQDHVADLSSYKAGAVYVICQSGGRSARGASILASQGYDAINVADGTASWIAQGFPVEK